MKKVFLFAIAALMSASMFAANITVAEAITIGEALDDGASTTDDYTVEGYCVKLVAAYDANFGNQSFYMDANKDADPSLKTYKFEVFRGKTDKEVLPQSKVTITGKIMKYVSKSGTVTIEISSGQLAVLEEGVAIEVIDVAKALEIGNALADNGSTNKYYTVQGYAAKAYPADEGYTSQNIYMADDYGVKGDFYAFRAEPGKDNTISDGDFIAVTGLIIKYVASGKDPVVEISGGFCKKVEEPQAINNVNAQSVKAMKVVENGQLFIIRNGVKYNAAGAIVK